MDTKDTPPRDLARPKVSIIINNFNYALYLEAAINSAIAQTYENLEIIVVDDGSTDTSREILSAYADRVLVLLKENGGQASALNLGFQRATGDLICFLDSDDALFPEAIKIASEAWNENVAKVQFPLEILNTTNCRTGLRMPRNPLSDGNVLHAYLQTGRYITSPTSGNLFSRNFLVQIFPIPEVEWAQTADGYINTCAPFFGSIKALAQPLAFYRVHGQSMSSVSYGSSIDLKQMEKLIAHAALERKLLQELARRFGYTASPTAVIGHWMHLKLRIAFYKLTDLSSRQRWKLLVSSALAMTRSVASARELSLTRKVQNILWTLGVILLPNIGAIPLIRYAFNPTPASLFARLARRA